MHPRTYALTLATAGIGVFLGVVGTNLLLDPQGVFGTGLFKLSAEANDRYLTLIHYQAAPRQYDGALFGSSRARAIPRQDLAHRLNAAQFADFTVKFGTLADHLPALRYLIKHKAERGEPLRAAFLLLDVDALALPPRTDRYIQALLPPEMSAERAARFWWKNATAIQFQAWRSSIRAAWDGAEFPTTFDPGLLPAPSAVATAPAAVATGEPAQMQLPSPPPSASASPGEPGPRAAHQPRRRMIETTEFHGHARLLQRFVATCREHGIRLIVATAPLNPALVAMHDDAGGFAEAVDRLSEIVPLWDFSRPISPLSRRELWRDLTHFRPELGQMMLDRIFQGADASGSTDFGRFRQPRRPESTQQADPARAGG